ncbi:MAG TPA: hypothetical protein DCZ92_02640 [Elusimicrobia bacterium]|nr:MAG: hypothetical protein A2016_02075 [Elusimicrobia bacterium GWF2_62_30]HBA59721.1 hypothetical protein [Elusimicrobiota bacterium]
MRKIKNFKIQVYSYEVLRRARKHKLDLAGIGLDDEAAMREYASGLATALEPALVFEYLAPEDALAMRINGDTPSPLTAGILTLGAPFEAKVDAAADDTHKRLNRIAAQIFLNTAVGVTTGLALREAEPEGFELSPAIYISSCPEQESQPQEATSVPLYENELIKALCARLEADKIGVSFDTGAFSPKYSAVFALPWLSRKKKKSASASKK